MSALPQSAAQRTPPAHEPRAHERTPITLHGTFKVGEDMEFACVLMDISPGGARVMASETPAMNAEVTISIAGLGKLSGSVVRSGSMEFAVQFTTCEGARENLARTIAWQFNRGRLNLPSNVRTATAANAPADAVVLDDGSQIETSVLELSISGVAYISTTQPAIGTRVQVGTMAGTVARHFETGFAVSFDPPSDAAGQS
jgi:hypothetical protein